MTDSSKVSSTAAILHDAADLMERKSKDYQGSTYTLTDYFPYGHTSYLQMLHTKMTRIKSVAEREDSNAVNFESLEDSLIDLINYSAFYIEFLRNQTTAEQSEIDALVGRILDDIDGNK